jgi:UDP-glucuronate decarboxylase
MQRQPDITLARKELDWEPKIKLRDGLVKTIEYFEELIKGGKINAYTGNR